MNTRSMRRRANGFSMIELMVSIVIGLLALGFATRLVVNGEATKQAAVGGSDSMQNGMLALFSIERELSQAGWGLNDPLIVGCDTVFSDTSHYDMLAPGGAGTAKPLAAVVIQSNGLASDVLSINSGTSMSNTGMARVANNYPLPGTASIDIDRPPYGFNGTDTVLAGGDVIVVAPESPGTQCALAQVSQVVAPAAPGQNQLRIAAGGNNRFNTGSLGVAFSNLQARLFNLGPASALSFHTWSADQGFLKLRASNLAGATETPVAVTDNIVSLKAEYGFDMRPGTSFTPELGMQPPVWSGTMKDADGDGVFGSSGDYQRIAAVRIAVVARSRAPERPNASGVCTATPSQFKVFGNSVPVTVAVPGDTVDWRCYRYRSFETIVPIRNSAWRPTP